LDWLLIRNERHLERVLVEFVDHYNAARPHRGIDLEVPDPPRRRLVFPTRSEFSELIDSADCFTSTASPPDPPWEARNYARPEGVQCTEPAEQCSGDGLRSETSTRCRVNRSPFFRNRVLAPFSPLAIRSRSLARGSLRVWCWRP
jgi:hypothetical protein